MVPFCRIPGLLSLLLGLHWNLGPGKPLLSTPANVSCTLDTPCPSNIKTQIRSQLMQLHRGADTLLAVYNTAQGEPFHQEADNLCKEDLPSFPAFHANSTEKDKLLTLHHIVTFMISSLDGIQQTQKALNPNTQDLHTRLSHTSRTLRGLLSNVLCRLCKEHHVGRVDGTAGLSVSGKSYFEQKQLGCQFLWKHKLVLGELTQAFQNVTANCTVN